MPLPPGARIGPYEVTGALGAGGMGQVYRARDTKLGRDVALKVVLESMVADAERSARFRREAQVLASLNHPNIATLYGTEELDGQHLLVMELVEGEDLSTIIARSSNGPKDQGLQLTDALQIARQIADALEAAHDQGIVHRDLKPGNIKVKADGTVKVLDFGLAKALAPEGDGATTSAMNSPTLTARATQMGMIIGTAAYMSPEQARGKAVDRRADIWAFGVVLYEMLTGRRAFEGDDISVTLANVIKEDVAWQSLSPDLPAPVRRLLRRCLEKNPRRRLSAIGDARLEIDDASARIDLEGGITRPEAVSIPAWRRYLPYAVGALGVAAGVAGVVLWMSAAEAPSHAMPVSRFVLPLPSDAPFVVHSSPGRAIALSADGTQIAYTTSDRQPDTRIRLRRLDDTEVRSLAGTERARAPFFSPDGRWLAYFDWAERALKKISVLGGQPVALQRGLANAGWTLGSWCDDGRIVFDTWNGGLRVVGSDGSDQRALTQPTDEWHLDPQPLPGPCRVLYFTYRTGDHAIHAISADGGTPKRILDNASHGRYLASGHLLFIRDSVLHIAPFDVERLAVTGPAVPAPIEVLPDWYNVSAPSPQLAVSRNGTLVYAPVDSTAGGSAIVSVTHDGQIEEIGVSPFFFPYLSLAPNGDDLAMSGRRAGRALIDTINLTHKATSNLADLGAVDMPAPPVWTPDRKAILYSRYGPFEGEIVRHELDGSAPDRVVARVPGTWICPWSLSPDGRWLIVSRYAPESQADLLLVDLQAAPGTAVKPLAATVDEEGLAAIAPDGQWVAYTVDRGEGREIIIDKFPEGGQKIRVAPTVNPPVWSAHGEELYFISYPPGSREVDVMAVRVAFTPRLSASAPRKLFSGSFMIGGDMGRSLTITGDGRRFLMVTNPPGVPPSSGTGFASRLMVVQNWFAELTAAKPR